jgi:peptidoglycan/xylan/chitin deacetylase (PgdA/CDA1 family)
MLVSRTLLRHQERGGLDVSLRALLHCLSPGGPRGRLTVLIFHRVRTSPDPLFPGEPDAQSFEQQMRWVRRWFEPLPLEEAVPLLHTGQLPPRALCITFDDGYADNLTVALPILQRLGLPATFFIATGFLDGGIMWNDQVIEAVRQSRLNPLTLEDLDLGIHPVGSDEEKRAAIAALIGALKYLPLQARAEKLAALVERTGARLPRDLMLTSDQLRALRQAGMGIGAHTVHHPILAKIGPQEAREEIVEGASRLEELLGEPVRLFAYPNGRPGRDYAPEHVAMVRKLGFAAAFSTAWGAAGTSCDPFQIPRFTPWDRTRIRYGLRLAQNLLRRPALCH